MMQAKFTASLVTGVIAGTSAFVLAAPAMAATDSAHVHGTITAVDGSTITVQDSTHKNSTTYTVDTSNTTKYTDVRWNNDERSESTGNSDVSVGDRLNARGSLNGDTLTAKHVTDRTGSPVHGKVTNIDGSTITIEDMKTKTTYTINTSSSTQFFTVNRNVTGKDRKSAANLSDVKVGDRVSTEGTQDGNTVDASQVNVRTR